MKSSRIVIERLHQALNEHKEEPLQLSPSHKLSLTAETAAKPIRVYTKFTQA